VLLFPMTAMTLRKRAPRFTAGQAGNR
jgi:hypothetical protein